MAGQDRLDAAVLREPRASLTQQTGNARTKAWRVLHRVTYVSRVPEAIPTRPEDAAGSAVTEQKKPPLLVDVSCNWLLLQKLEPLVRMATSRADLNSVMRPEMAKMFPTLLAQPTLYDKVLDLVGGYVGLSW